MEWNVHYSAFCLHARNLVDFLSNKGTFKAVDYAKKYRQPSKEGSISTALQGFAWQTFHSGKRTRNKADKVHTGLLSDIFYWIEDGLRVFYASLDPSYREMWKFEPFPHWIEVIDNGSTSSHVTTSGTFIEGGALPGPPLRH